MAAKTLAQKLYIRPGYTVALLNAPKGAADLLAPLPDEVTLVTKLGDSKPSAATSGKKAGAAKARGSKTAGATDTATQTGDAGQQDQKIKIDLVLCFVKTSAELETQAKELKQNLAEDTVLWIAYPKLSGKTGTDLTRDKGWQAIYDLGFAAVANVAIDSVWSALRFKLRPAQTSDEMVAKLFEGERAAYLPLYEQLASRLSDLGPDVSVAPRQSYVAFARGKQFALLMPAKDRLDLVLRLPTASIGGRLIRAPSLGSGSMTHRVPITKVDDIDMDVLGWIGDAYRAANIAA